MSRSDSSSRKKRKASRKKGKPRVPRYSTLTAREKAKYDRTTNLVTDLRGGKGPYTKLLRKYHLGARAARKYGGRDLVGGTRGKPVRASKSDRRVRDLWFPDSFGDGRIRTRSSRDATKLSDYYNDRDKLLDNKMSAEEFEAKWHGVRVNSRELYADAVGIFRMENAGVLKLENLYASVGSER
jgi:hypothetical protein